MTKLEIAKDELDRQYSGELCAGRGDPISQCTGRSMALRIAKEKQLSVKDSAVLLGHARRLCT